MKALAPIALVLAGLVIAASLTPQSAVDSARPGSSPSSFEATDAAAEVPRTAEADAVFIPADAAWDTGTLTGVMALGTADSLLEEPYWVGSERRTLQVSAGDTLLGLILPAVTASQDAHEAVAALETAFDPRDLQIGQEITLVLEHQGHETALTGLEIMPDVDRVVVVSRTEDPGFAAEVIANDLDTRRIAVGGRITESLAADAERAGVPYAVLHPLIRIFAHRLDLQRDLQPGDRFEIVFERDHHEDGRVARLGEVVYGRIVSEDHDVPIYRFQSADGLVDYYDADGVSIRRALLRTPLVNARMSSGYGMRRHPILGYTRMHRGVDFASPSGTPIVAAGNGVVEIAGWRGGYGNYIRLRHNRRLGTAYAHMSRLADGIRPGARVRQGQVIGYVGSTGLSTGPHLHYEVMVDGAQVNPLSVDLPVGRTLGGADRTAFQAMVAELQGRFANLDASDLQMADHGDDGDAPPLRQFITGGGASQ